MLGIGVTSLMSPWIKRKIIILCLKYATTLWLTCAWDN